MAVSKRLRYEILRRDNFACQYCGAKAPAAELTVDHVTPVALGGTDQPSNLAAACRDCNSGKSASSPDAPLVEHANAVSLAWRVAMMKAAEDGALERQWRDQRREEFRRAWDRWTFCAGSKVDRTVPLPQDWARTVDELLEAGLTVADLDDCVTDTMSRGGFVRDEFRYFCGVARRLLERRHELASQHLRSMGAG